MIEPSSFEEQTVSEIASTRKALVAVAVAVVLAVAFAAYGFATASSATDAAAVVAKHQAAVAHRVAVLASAKAKTANGVSVYAFKLLQAEAAGECYRVNYLRWQVDRARYADWRRDRYSARFLQRLHHRSTSALARYFSASAGSEEFLPLTDCTLATGTPTTYRPPGAVPFHEVPRSVLRRVLSRAPQPPAAP